MDHLPIPTKGVLCELQINSNRSIHQTLIYLQSIRIDNHVLNRLSIVSINDVNQICFGILNNSRITHFDRFLLFFLSTFTSDIAPSSKLSKTTVELGVHVRPSSCDIATFNLPLPRLFSPQE